jgi:iron complex outermembrane receptor protein
MGFQSVFRSGRLSAPLALAGLIVAAYAPDTFAAAAGVEEITVTAQRTEEGIQDVPIAVSAFTGTMLDDKQIINPSDLQMNTPNDVHCHQLRRIELQHPRIAGWSSRRPAITACRST